MFIAGPLESGCSGNPFRPSPDARPEAWTARRTCAELFSSGFAAQAERQEEVTQNHRYVGVSFLAFIALAKNTAAAKAVIVHSARRLEIP